VTTPYSQTIEIDGIRHAIPIGKDILAQDAVYADLMDRARAILAQPELQGPSDEAIMRLACISLGYEYTPSLLSSPENDIGALDALPSELLAFARAVLQRFGRPDIEPVAQQQEVE
jgi:hypothetical protein